MIETDKYIGIPFLDGGRDLKGIDCWGLVKLVHQDEFGNELPEFLISSSDAKSINRAMTSKEELSKWVEVREAKLIEPGDVVAMSLSHNHPDFVTHVGVCTGRGMFLHAMEGGLSAICRLSSPEWCKRIRGFYRWAK